MQEISRIVVLAVGSLLLPTGFGTAEPLSQSISLGGLTATASGDADGSNTNANVSVGFDGVGNTSVGVGPNGPSLSVGVDPGLVPDVLPPIGGGDPGVDPNNPGRAVGLGNTAPGAGGVQNLLWLIGMPVISSDRQVLGTLDEIRARNDGYALRLRVADGLNLANEYVTVLTRSVPDATDVIHLNMSLRNFLNQI
jgi:hypothetical protein